MSSINKELRITAVLDDANIKKQIKQLKQELSSTLEVKAIKNTKSIRQDIEKEQDEHWKQIAKRLQKEERERIKMERKVELERKNSELRLQDLREKRLNEQIRKSELARQSPLARAGGALGRMAGGMGAVGAGILGAGYGLVGIRRSLAEREFRETSDATQGKFLESIARQSGRREFLPKAGGAVGGALAGAAGGAALGSFLGPLGTLAGGAIGGIGGGIAGALGLSKAQGELRVEQVKPILEAFDKAKATSGQRLQMLRGGGGMSSGLLNAFSTTGADLGFSAEETFRQMQSARGVLGNKAAGGLIGRLQDLTNVTGADAGVQASGIEAIAGAGRTSRFEAESKQFELLKKGVAAGLDVSKATQLFKENTQLLQDISGFGAVDSGRVGSNLARYARGFAGEGDITDLNLSQASRLIRTTKEQSTSKSGFSGIGNISAMQDILGPNADPGQLIDALNISSTADPKEVARILKISPEKAQQIIAAKGRTIERGFEEAGLSGSGMLGLQAMEMGITTEEAARVREAKFGKPLMSDFEAEGTLKAARTQVEQSPDFQLAKEQAKLEQIQITEGLGQFKVSTDQAAIASQKLAEALTVAKDRLKEMTDNLKLLPGN